MQEYSSKISQNIIDKFGKIAKEINKNLSEQPLIRGQIKRYEETQETRTTLPSGCDANLDNNRYINLKSWLMSARHDMFKEEETEQQ